MGFGNFDSICSKAAIPLCSLVGPPSSLSGNKGFLTTCYARNIEVANTIIFQVATAFMHILALGMTSIMIIHVRSKFTAVGMYRHFCSYSIYHRRRLLGFSANNTQLTVSVGRKEITTFFYIYMALTICSLVVDCGVTPPGSASYPYFAAVQNGLASALCTCLLINGFVGFQLYEDGTKLSVWLLRLSSLSMFIISGAVSLLTFQGWGGLSPTNTVGLFVVVYILNAICLFVYLVMQIILVVNTLDDRWPLGHIFFGTSVFIVGQVLLYGFSSTICENVKHYLDGLFFVTVCNLFAVMMIYKVSFCFLPLWLIIVLGCVSPQMKLELTCFSVLGLDNQRGLRIFCWRETEQLGSKRAIAGGRPSSNGLPRPLFLVRKHL